MKFFILTFLICFTAKADMFFVQDDAHFIKTDKVIIGSTQYVDYQSCSRNIKNAKEFICKNVFRFEVSKFEDVRECYRQLDEHLDLIRAQHAVESVSSKMLLSPATAIAGQAPLSDYLDKKFESSDEWRKKEYPIRAKVFSKQAEQDEDFIINNFTYDEFERGLDEISKNADIDQSCINIASRYNEDRSPASVIEDVQKYVPSSQVSSNLSRAKSYSKSSK